MKTIETTAIPADALADLEQALRLQATGRHDLGFEKRVGEQAAKIRQEILAEHGVLNVAVELVREGRNEGMKYVLDASVALKWVLTEPDSAKALSIRDDFRQQLHELLAPDVFPVEIAHALTRAERKGLLQPPQAIRLLADILSTPMPLHPYLPLLPRSVALSSAMRCGVYDCLYIALAEQEGCEFITADDKLVKNLGAQFPFVVSLASLP